MPRQWRACSSASVRSSSPAPRTSSCSSSARCRSVCSRFIGSSIGPPSGCAGRRSACCCGDRPHLRVLRHLRRPDGGPRHAALAATRGLWRSHDYWIGIGLAAFTSVGLTVPFFLPYLARAARDGLCPYARRCAAYSANLQAWGASAAWAHRWWLPALDGYNEVLFPGDSPRRCWGSRGGGGPSGSAKGTVHVFRPLEGQSASCRFFPRDTAIHYI